MKFIKKLKESVDLKLRLGVNCEEERNTLISLLNVIEYYSTPSDYLSYLTSIEEKLALVLHEDDIYDTAGNSLKVMHVSDNADGSANMEVHAGSKVKEQIYSEGFNFLLIKALLEGTTDQILNWAQAGKQSNEHS
jgi:hypothetical protein